MTEDIRAGDFVKHYKQRGFYKVSEVIYGTPSLKYGEDHLRCWLWENEKPKGRLRHLALTSAIKMETIA